MAKDRKPLGILAMLAVSAILVSAVLAVNADAARGAGKGGGKNGGGSTPPPSTATCSVTPNPATQQQVVVITGSGFAASGSVGITVSGSGGTQMGFAMTDEFGAFSREWTASWPGTETVTAAGGGATGTCTFQTV
ncbi:MAG: hypothetical protein E6I38_04170 [Chloroflexi bacterium]|nr:MAG: hypothetical protein E6I38_04170 [Chloroflexota bacterium]